MLPLFATTMLPQSLISMALLIGASWCSLVNIARQAPDSKIKLSPAASLSLGIPDVLPPVSATVASTAWIKDYLQFFSKTPELRALEAPAPSLKPMRTKITNYGSRLSNEHDLSEFTRHLVEQLREEYEPKPKPKKIQKQPVIDLDIDQFIAYLIEHKGFTEKQLAFLRRPKLDYGYETIEKELTMIRRQQNAPKNISVGGESAASRPATQNVLTFLVGLVLWL